MSAPRASTPAGSTKQKVFATMVMDRSGSMERFGSVPLRAINDYLLKLQRSAQAASLEASIVVFDHATDTLIPMKPIAQIGMLRSYKNGHGTRLHGTVADVLERLIARVAQEQAHAADVTASIAVFTDGEDTSRPAGKHLNRLRHLVVSAGDLGFQLIAVGIGIDGKALAKELWFPENGAITVDPDGIEILKAAEDVSQMVEDFSAGFRASDMPKPE